jgi:hypothetical protein
MNEMLGILGSWQLDAKAVRERMYSAPTPRERERWHAVWLLTRGWSAGQVAEAFERDGHTIGDWVEELREQGPTGLAFVPSGGSPRPRPGATGRVEGGGAGCAERCGPGLGQLELEGGAAVRADALWPAAQ